MGLDKTSEARYAAQCTINFHCFSPFRSAMRGAFFNSASFAIFVLLAAPPKSGRLIVRFSRGAALDYEGA